jgi:histidinol-phosphate aminotransferase
VTSLNDLPIRADLAGLKPYGAPQLEVSVALNVNENTHRIPETVAQDIVERLAAAVLRLNRYPDREFTSLRAALAGYLGVGLSAENLWAANGSNEVIQQILQAFGGVGRTAMGFGPTYSMYGLLSLATQTRYIDAPRGERFELTAELVSSAIANEKPNIVLLCSPNNPTGTPVALEVIIAAYEALPKDAILVVDEAYAEFAGPASESALTLLAGRPRLLVSRTMSKAFAFAGARVGYLAADAAVVDAMRLVRLPYHLSALTQAAAEAALAHAPEMLAMVDDIKFQRDRIVMALTELGYDPYRSASNFVLFGAVEDPAATWQLLLERGVLIRNVGIPNTLRVSAGTQSETTAFIDAMDSLK